jgi:hypothetical protein
MRTFRMGQLYRYRREIDTEAPTLDGIGNFHYLTHMPGLPGLQLEKGIDSPQATPACDGKRVGVILLSSNYHKRGSAENPWHDTIEPDEGFARYYGDNKTPGDDPAGVRGNRLLLNQFDLHTSADKAKRSLAAPLLIFRSGTKGYKEFCGLGVLTGARRVTQYSQKNGGFFTNYLFDIAILSLTEEDESVNLLWIKHRRDPSLPLVEANHFAPRSWLEWIKHGTPVIDKIRRQVARYHIISKPDQVPSIKTPQRDVLETVYNFYQGKQARFEALASVACESAIRATGNTYKRGWLTQSTGDGGLDFVGRVDLGEGFSRAKLVVLGQAKCEKIDSPTGGVHVARTVARLRRGWLGAYVTTSFFSNAVQKEVYEDQYPVILLNGMRVAEEVRKLELSGGFASTMEFLNYIDAGYEEMVSPRHPEEILWD